MQIQETESRYPVKRSAMKLTCTQRGIARGLLAERPTVIPGTRAILNREEAVIWFTKVRVAMKDLNLRDELVGPFCDVAGVPD